MRPVSLNRRFPIDNGCAILGAEVLRMDETRELANAPQSASDEWPRLDRTAFTVGFLGEESDEKEYWLTKTPLERLQAMELMRRMSYGHDRATARLQRVLEIAEREAG